MPLPMPNSLSIIVRSARAFVREPNGEHEQAVVRLVLASFLCGYVLWQTPLTELSHQLGWTMGVFLLVSTLLLVHLVFYHRPMPARRLIGIINDAAGITFGLLYAGELGVPIYLFYLWITFGNGFRFGRRYLYAALTASLVGFSIVLLTVEYWQQHRSLGMGLWIGMVLVGMYFSTLVARLTKALQHEEAVNQAKRRFISSVSHELRTPLNAIIGMANLLQSTALNDEQEDMVRSLDNASHVMLALVEDVLDFSKIEAGKLIIEETHFDLRHLITTTIDVFKYQAVARGLELVSRIDPAVPPALVGDPSRLRQVLVNLISNAIKFTEKGHVQLHIACLLDLPDSVQLRFEVKDTGIGIAVEAQSKVFESFTQADNSTSRRYGGTGLGTTISRELVQLMGGYLGLRSEVGVGSTFWFELALKKDKAHAGVPGALPLNAAGTGQTSILVPSAAPTLSPTLSPTSSPAYAALDANITGNNLPYQVLVAEDNPVNRTVIQKLLERAGHSCHLVDNGDEALDAMELQEFDVVILDMNMPVMNGIDATRAMRALAAPGRHMPIIMLSADVTGETKREATDAGVDQFLPKPIQIDVLLTHLNQLVARYGRRPVFAAERVALEPIPTVRVTPEDSAVLNYATLAELESIGRDSRFVDDLINGFVVDTQQLMQRCEQALLTHRHEEFRDLLHAIKGSAMSIGAISLRSTCEHLEQCPTAELQRSERSTHDSLQNAFAQICAALDRYRLRRSEAMAQQP